LTNRKAAILAGVGAVALALRALYVRQIGHAPFFDLRIGDAAAYHSWAQAIAGGDWIGHGVFYQAPLYPYLLAAIYKAFGESVTTVRLAHALIGAGSCVLLAAAGMRLLGRRGAIAGLLPAIYPSAIFLDGVLEKSAVVTFLTATLLYVLARPVRRGQAFAAGITLGLLGLTRENALLLIVPVVLWVVFSREPSAPRTPGSKPGTGGRKLAWSCYVLVGSALVLLPVTLRNYAVGGEFAITTSQFGPNFYIGNHAGAPGTYEALVRGHGSAADEQTDAKDLAERATGRVLTSKEVSEFWWKQSLAYISAQPFAWLKQLGRKFALTFNAAELADTESEALYAEWSPLLRILKPFNFGVLFGLAAFGAVLTARFWRQFWFLYALAVTYTLSLVMFFVFARYRFPLVPILMVLAAGSVAPPEKGAVPLLTVKGAVPLLGRSTLLTAIGAAAIAIAFSHLPLGSSRDALVTHELNIANALSNDPARLATAMEFYQRALREAPQLPQVQSSFAMFLARTGNPQEAIAHYRAALEAWPDDAPTRFNLGLALAATGQADEALRELNDALRLRPSDVEMHIALAQVLAANGHPDLAAQHYQQALAIVPRNPSALVGWGIVLVQLRRPDEAVKKFRLALEIDPRSTEASGNLGWTLANQGKVAEAIPYFERALALNPGDENIKRNLERARQLR
jgi:Tfp pilus assembly protein PilF